MAVKQCEDHHREHPHMDFRSGEVYVIAGKTKIAGEEDPHSSGHDVPARQGHGRLRATTDVQEQLPELAPPKSLAFGIGKRRFQVGACAKDLVSRTRDGNDACRKGIHGVPQALPDSSENCRIQSIPLLGTVDRDACHPVFNRIQNLAHKLYLRRKISFWRADFTGIWGQSPKSPKSQKKNLRREQTNLRISVTVPKFPSWYSHACDEHSAGCMDCTRICRSAGI